MRKIYYFDIETNGIEDFVLLSDLKVVHCLSIYDRYLDKVVTFSGDSIETGLKLLDSADIILGHNVIKFDIPALQKLYPWTPKAEVYDTLVMCRAIETDLRSQDVARHNFPEELIGSQSLKAWGYRLDGINKLDFGSKEGAFDVFTEEMKEYCEIDAIITAGVGNHIREQNPSNAMINIEHQFAKLMRQQEMRGFAFNEEKAERLVMTLTSRRAELADKLHKVFPPEIEEMKTPQGWQLEIKTSDDDLLVITKETKGAIIEELKARGMVQALAKKAVKLDVKSREIPFNPNSRPQIADRLMELGWKPKQFTMNGKPKIDEDILSSMPYPEAEPLLEYLMVSKRLSMIEEGDGSWLNNVVNGRIHGQVNTGGAVTGRCTHSNPNIAQVPAVGVPYGKECREMFEAGRGYKLVGCDASGLELRMLAHYMFPFDGGRYADEILTGDIHTMNQKAAGLETRDQAKTFIYAFLYGAGDAKIGSIVGGNSYHGKRLREKFLSSLPALARLKDYVEVKVKKGMLGLDGRRLKIRSAHSALNMLLQSAGAIVMKQALITLDEYLRCELGWANGREYAFVANIHDEFQAEVRPDLVTRYGPIAQKSIREAGRILRVNCPLDGEYKVGTNWAETH
jgi:DNA polymerase-1